MALVKLVMVVVKLQAVALLGLPLLILALTRQTGRWTALPMLPRHSAAKKPTRGIMAVLV